MRIRVLGSAAGGGFPQWNCGCFNCHGVRTRTIRATPRTQASLAVSMDETRWVLLGASPDVRVQIEGFPSLHPCGTRHSPIVGVILNNADLDQCLGLLSLREFQPLQIWSTDRVRQSIVNGNVFAQALNRFPKHTTWHALKLETEHALRTIDEDSIGLSVTPISIPGKLPLYLEGRLRPDQEDNVGLLITDTAGHRLAYLPTIGRSSPELTTLLQETDCVLFDGTFWSSDELSSMGYIGG